MMGGKLGVKSTIGQGSVFWVDVSLPPVDSWTEVTKPQKTAIVAYKGPRRSVLIVDDNAENRAMLYDLLAPLGFDVTEASNGQEGIEQAKAMHPDVILMDLVMPGMDGFEATRRIRKFEIRKPKAEIRPVILGISASTFEEDREKSLEAGCDDFIPKPINADDVLEKLQQHLSLEWVYAEVKPRADEAGEAPASIVPPSSDELEALMELAIRGDIRGVQQRADELVQREPRLKPFATELNQLAKRFRINEIRELLKSFKGDK